MCGIAAILKRRDVESPAGALAAMIRAVAHRGPDGEGSEHLRLRDGSCERVTDGGWHAALGHRRLAILDLSDAARQPMQRGALWITYNGEIYNYVELRRELETLGEEFRSASDTEVLLAAYARWGTASFARLKGMWAFVLVDGTRGEAVLCRDRLGIKPLYTHHASGVLYACSEPKQLAAAGLALAVDDAVINEYLRTGHEDPRRTFYSEVEPLPPGTWRRVRLEDVRVIDEKSFWHPERIIEQPMSRDAAAQKFRELFERSVREHLRSDVPVGCALSGGLDSSAVATMVARVRPISAPMLHTFTATFPGDPIDEASWARTVADVTGATPHFVEPTPAELLADLDRFTWVHDEPVGTLAMYAGYCVARAACAAGVPVALNGQGGDEVFAGYWQSYFMYLRGLARQGHGWTLLRHAAGSLLGGNPELLRQVPVMLRRYHARRSPHAVLRLKHESAAEAAPRVLDRILGLNEAERRLFEIREMYLPRLLRWDDRNFMAFGVEGRYPFLDHELIEGLLSVSPALLYDRGYTKAPLRRGLAGVVPHAILQRRTKLGFETPQDKWLCGPLRPSVEQLVAGDSPAWRYVEPKEAQRLARNVFSLAGRRDEPGQALLRLFFLDRWLRVSSVGQRG